MTQFYLIRHGETHYQLADRYNLIGGARELVPLTKHGEKEVAELAVELKDVQPDLIVVSPLTRAMQTAVILNRTFNVPVQVEYDLHEWWCDTTFQYASSRETIDAFLEMMQLKGEWPAGQPQKWEQLSSVRERVNASLRHYTQYNTVFVVCHSGVIYSLLNKLVKTATHHLYHSEALN